MGDGIHPVGVREGHSPLLIDVAVVASACRVVDSLAGCRIIGSDRNTAGCLEVDAIVAGISNGVQAVVEGSLGHGGEITTGVQ